MRNNKKLTVIDGETLMDMRINPISFCIDSLLPQGVSMLCGAPKIGKSWLVLDWCVRIAKRGSMENEFRYRQEQYFGKPQAEKQQLADSDRTALRRNESDFDSVTGQGGRTHPVENGNNISAGAVQYDFKNLNGRPDGGISGENSGNQQRQYEINLTELSGGAEESFATESKRNQVGANEDDRIYRTGWEESRRIFEQYLAKRSGVGIGNSITSEKVNFADYLKMDSNNHTVLGSINSLAESLSRIIDDESEDEEERRKRIEAEQNGSDIGTLLGLTIGLVAGAISNSNIKDDEYDLSEKHDNKYDEELDDSPTIQM